MDKKNTNDKFLVDESDLIFIESDVENSAAYNPYRDASGRFTFGAYSTYPQLKGYAQEGAEVYKSIKSLKEQSDNTPFDSGEWLDINSKLYSAQKQLDKIRTDAYTSHKLDPSVPAKNLRDWSEGLGPRNSKGEYLSTPMLQKNLNDPNIKFERAFQQAVLFESGIKKITVYRGQKEGYSEAQGLKSTSSSKAVAYTFGDKVKKYSIPIERIVSHHSLLNVSSYSTEDEIIIE